MISPVDTFLLHHPPALIQRTILDLDQPPLARKVASVHTQRNLDKKTEGLLVAGKPRDRDQKLALVVVRKVDHLRHLGKQQTKLKPPGLRLE